MTSDASGRWLSRMTVAAFSVFVHQMLARLEEAGCAPSEVFLDLEPPIAVTRAWREGRKYVDHAVTLEGGLRTAFPDYGMARRQILELVRHIEECGVRVSTAIAPFLVWDPPGSPLARALGTPAFELPVRSHQLMAYTSMMEGWSNGLLGRRSAERMLSAIARVARMRLGHRAAISLGAVGPGALGDEPCYRGPEELRADVSRVAAAGIAEVALFELHGVLSRGPAEAWLDALANQ